MNFHENCQNDTLHHPPMPNVTASSPRVTKAEAARRLGVSRPTLYAYLSKQGAPQPQNGLFDLAEVRAYLVDHAPAAGPALEAREHSELVERCRQYQAVLTVQASVLADLPESMAPAINRAFLKGWTAHLASGKHSP